MAQPGNDMIVTRKLFAFMRIIINSRYLLRREADMHMEMLSGNEAVARGVYEAGCHVAAAYPGTPSTEILENIGEKYKDEIYCQWACNEKTAVEIAGGASIGGARAFAAMKHVGMNVAADPIFTLAYSGVNGGRSGLPQQPERAGQPPVCSPCQNSHA